MARRTKEEALATRCHLLDTAERMFNEKGVSRTSLGDIAEAAGMTRGAIYWHFKDKADLFNAMVARVTLPIEEMAHRAGDDDLEDPLNFVRNCALAVLERTTTDAQCRRVFDIFRHKCEYVDDTASVKARHLDTRAQCLAQIERALSNAIRKGQLPKATNARRAAVGLHALVDGLITNWLLDPGYFPLEKEAAQLIDQYIAGLRVPRASET
jgi:TetR/AcrR family acrAB operon transcriptional repressor